MMKSGGNCLICKLVCLLVIVGAINWGLVGIWNYDLVARLLGNAPIVARVVYILIGLAGLIKLISCFKACPCCKTEECKMSK